MKPGMFFGVMVLILSVSIAFGADIDGKWVGKYDSGMGGDPMDMEYTFKADGSKLTGTTIGGGDGEQIQITNGKIDGSKLSFTVTVDMMGMEMVFDYTGELKGDTLNLKFEMGGEWGMTGEFTVQKAK